MTKSKLRRLVALAIAACALVALPAAASADTKAVTGGTFTWKMANFYASAFTADGEFRTFLGWATRSTTGSPEPAPNGTVTAAGGVSMLDPTGAAITEIDPSAFDDVARTKTDLYTFTFPVDPAGSTYDPDTGVGTVQLDGTLTVDLSSPYPDKFTMVDPKVILNGFSVKIVASGLALNDTDPGTAGNQYGYGEGTFATGLIGLDGTDASITQRLDGSWVFNDLHASNHRDRQRHPQPVGRRHGRQGLSGHRERLARGAGVSGVRPDAESRVDGRPEG